MTSTRPKPSGRQHALAEQSRAGKESWHGGDQVAPTS